jgi:hypothetical protein
MENNQNVDYSKLDFSDAYLVDGNGLDEVIYINYSMEKFKFEKSNETIQFSDVLSFDFVNATVNRKGKVISLVVFIATGLISGFYSTYSMYEPSATEFFLSFLVTGTIWGAITFGILQLFNSVYVVFKITTSDKVFEIKVDSKDSTKLYQILNDGNLVKKETSEIKSTNTEQIKYLKTEEKISKEVYDELIRLKSLHEMSIIDSDEYRKFKDEVLKK